MDDDLDGPNSGGGDEDLSLPKATMAKLIQELLPTDISSTKETRDLLTECCVEFIHLVSSEANEICEKEAKKTIAGEHVISALKNLGFEDYVPEMEELLTDHQKSLKDREKRSARMDNSGMTQEELIQFQEQMFAKAKERMASGVGPSTVDIPTTENGQDA
ncbi:histone-fold-containing protein [Globomyces pollinis-pini]|nr:histone-fold-containing protein [Globomyces pollinis-pini]KAJ2999344.1 negative cofactor 2 transcription regulator complex subunit ncb2 [Globomyces sp. JEL0801]